MKFLAIVVILSPLLYLACLVMEKKSYDNWLEWETAQNIIAGVGSVSLVVFTFAYLAQF